MHGNNVVQSSCSLCIRLRIMLASSLVLLLAPAAFISCTSGGWVGGKEEVSREREVRMNPLYTKKMLFQN